MKIRITDLPTDGLTVKENLPVGPLNERMSGGKLGNDISFITPPLAVVVARPTTNGGEAFGEIIAQIRQSCGRCAEPKEREIRAEISLSLSYDPPPTDGEFSDLGIIQIKEGSVDLEEELCQALISEINLFWNAELDITDKCTLCKKAYSEFSEEKKEVPTLGALLEKALKEKKN